MTVKIVANVKPAIAGTYVMHRAMLAHTKAGFRKMMQQAYDRSQEYVHVDTGLLRSTGRLEENDSGSGDLEITLIYGGEDHGVDYAGWHELEYPYIVPAMEEAIAMFGPVNGDLL